jgi:hypothetical protein
MSSSVPKYLGHLGVERHARDAQYGDAGVRGAGLLERALERALAAG